MEEGLFPHSGANESSSADGRDEEEERRLFYVAMTRAKSRLYLTLARVGKIYGNDYLNEPSSFLADIDNSLMLYDESNGEKIIRPKKSLGQNFLMHARIAERIANVAKLSPDATVFEIGPGTGMLTRPLLKRAGKVIAVEMDRELFERLQFDFANEISDDRLKLFYGDVRSFDIETLPKGYTLVANIPYYLTGEIFRKFLESLNQPSAMTLLVQKEVAERIARSKKESILSLSVKAYGTPKYEFTGPARSIQTRAESGLRSAHCSKYFTKKFCITLGRGIIFCIVACRIRA